MDVSSTCVSLRLCERISLSLNFWGEEKLSVLARVIEATLDFIRECFLFLKEVLKGNARKSNGGFRKNKIDAFI